MKEPETNKEWIAYAIGNVIAVFLLPFYMIYMNYKEWKDGKRGV